MTRRARLYVGMATLTVASGIVTLRPTQAAIVDPARRTLVSVNAAGTDAGNAIGTSGSYPSLSVSADGTKVAFVSVSTDLITTPDTNGLPDVYVRDLTTGVTQLVSVNAAGSDSASGQGVANAGSHLPQLSADGTAVVFLSDGRDLVTTPLGNFNSDNLYVRDLVAQTTYLVNVNQDGTEGSDSAADYHPSISSDGSRVAFASDSDDLQALPTGSGNPQVFVRDLTAGTTTLVSVNSAGTAATVYSSSLPDIDASGTKVAFASGGSDLAPPAGGGGSAQAWVRDLTASTTTLMTPSTTSPTAFSNGSVADLQISDDGTAVGFESNATDLTSDADTNNAVDVFIRRAGTTTLLSKGPLGSGNRGAGDFALAGDGNAVAFVGYASDLVPNPAEPATDANAVSDVFVSNLLYDGGYPRLVSANGVGNSSGLGRSDSPSINYDGTRVTFISPAPDLTDPPIYDQGSTDVYVREPFISETTIISDGAAPNADTSGNANNIGDGEVYGPYIDDEADVVVPISADGSRVAFSAIVQQDDYGIHDTNNAWDVYAVDLHNDLIFEPTSPVGEGDGSVTVTITRTGMTGTRDTVDFTTANGLGTTGAAAGSDYTAKSGTVVFQPGEITKTVTVAMLDDSDPEGDEQFRIVLSNPGGAARLPSTAQRTITIVDNESSPTSSTSPTTLPPAPAACEPALTGGPGNDVIQGTPGPDHICGRGGNDTIDGLGGDDIIEGGRGKDTLRGDEGSDVLWGGDGNDHLIGGPQWDRLRGEGGYDTCLDNGDQKRGCDA